MTCELHGGAIYAMTVELDDEAKQELPGAGRQLHAAWDRHLNAGRVTLSLGKRLLGCELKHVSLAHVEHLCDHLTFPDCH